MFANPLQKKRDDPEYRFRTSPDAKLAIEIIGVTKLPAPKLRRTVVF